MKLKAEIIVEEDIDNIKQVFVAEETNFKNKRASYKIKKLKDKLVFKIISDDSSSLRAILNSITKTISVYETSKKIIKA